MKVEKEARKLGIEELERRAAPVLYSVEDPEAPAPDPGTGDGGSGGSTTTPEVADQPGNSDGNRNKLWHRSEP